MRREEENNGRAFPLILMPEGSVLVIKPGILPAANLRICPVILGTACASQVVVKFFFLKSMQSPLKETKW